MSDILTTLTAYARLGWRVLPVHSVQYNVCSCRKRQSCDHPGKHPMFVGGCHSATTDEATIQTWVDLNSSANWGIATGQASGLLVLDIDPRHGGDESLDELVRLHGDLPKTPTVKTGGGGRQFYFWYPSGSGLTIGSGVRPGIDFRGEGGLVVVPPSVHMSGLRYEWLVLPETPVADPPDWLVELLTKRAPSPRSGEQGGMILTFRGETPDLTGDGVSEGGRHTALCQRVGVHLNRGDSRQTVETLAKAWGERCDPPMNESEVEQVLNDLWNKHHDRDADDGDADGNEPKPDAPVLHPDAFQGLFGELVRAVSPHTEADDAAMLLALLTAFGSACGWSPSFDHGRRHGANLFLVLVGATASRKGTATNIARSVIGDADPEWSVQCLRSEGFGTGEGLIHAVRDDRTLVDGTTEPGVADKRLLVVEEEMAKMFSLGAKEASILTPTIRGLFDRSTIGKLNKDAYRCQRPHGSIIANITPADLRQALTGKGAVGLANGFVNRFLLCHTGRRKFHPRGGRWRSAAEPFVPRISEALAKAKGVGLVELNDEAGREWDAVYPKLEDHPDTVFGVATSRASDQVMKLALVFALADKSDTIRTAHLTAALSCWRYCEATARLLFQGVSATIPGTASAEVLAVRLLGVITGSPGINRRDLYRAVGGKVGKGEMNAALDHIQGNRLAHPKHTDTDGRPAECWFPGPDQHERKTVLKVGGDDRQVVSVPTAEEPSAVYQQRALVQVEEIPTLPDGSLTRLSVPQLFDEVRNRKGRFAWVGGKVGVVGVDPVPDDVACAVAEHQSDLRALVPAEPQVCL